MHILNMTIEEYAAVATPDSKIAEVDSNLEEITLSLRQLSLKNSAGTLPANEPPRRIFLNIEKKRKYLKDQGTLSFTLLQALNDDDQALLDEYQAPRELWTYLKSKYCKHSKIAAAQRGTN